MFTNDELKGKWTEIKGEISKKWGQLTENDLETTKGNFTSLLGLLQQKLGFKKEEAEQHLSDVASNWRAKVGNTGSNLANSANQKIDEAKENLKH